MIIPILMFIFGIAFGLMLKTIADYYQEFIIKQQKLTEQMALTMAKWELITEEKAKINKS